MSEENIPLNSCFLGILVMSLEFVVDIKKD